jgi:hypothetical protein
MVLVKVVWEVSDVSDEDPSEDNILVARGGRTNWAWSLFNDTGDPYTSHHFLDGYLLDGGGGPYGDECDKTSSF